MAQEFAINSSNIESKINQLLPSQGGFGAGVDFSASTMVIPIVDLTETAEGSALRQDLQTSIGFTGLTNTLVTNALNTTIVNTTGYWRVFGAYAAVDAPDAGIYISDGTTTKTIVQFSKTGGVIEDSNTFDYNVYVKAGESIIASCNSTNPYNWISISVRQLADINGNLTNP